MVMTLIGGEGCSPKAKMGTAEDKNPYLLAGRDWMASGNAAKARHNFEQALAINPRSPLAHYELGLLNERFERDYVSAIYHYRQAMRLRPDGYPADNAKYRIESCRQELVKAELIAPVAQNMVRELDRLKRENAQLKAQLETASVRPIANRSGQTAAGTSSGSASPSEGAHAGSRVSHAISSGSNGSSTQFHSVQKGETVYRIAKQYRISQQRLLQANPGLNPRHLVVGQKLRIPPPN